MTANPVFTSQAVDLVYCFCHCEGNLHFLSTPNIYRLDSSMRDHFRRQWVKRFSESSDSGSINYSVTWLITASCIKSILSEFDGNGCGWRVGKLGKAEHIDTRMTAHTEALRTSLAVLGLYFVVPIEPNLSTSTDRFVDCTLAGSSMSPDVARRAIQLLNFAAEGLSRRERSATIDTVDAIKTMHFDSSLKHMKQIFVLLSLMACEQLLFLLASNALGFIQAVAETSARRASLHKDVLSNRLVAGLECLR